MGWSPIRQVKKAASNVAKAVVGGVEVVADDFLGIDDSGGIVGSVKKIGEKVEDGLREAVDEVDKVLENPYVRLAVSIAYPPAAPYLNAYAKLDSGEELNAADIAAIAASAGQDFGAFEAANIDPEVVNNIKKGVQVATADNPGEAFLMNFGADVAAETGFTDAFDSTIADTFGQDTLDVLKQNENYIVDSARFASGNMSEQELIAKYGAGAVDYATSGTAAEDYSKYLADAINVGVGNKSIEDVLVDQYGEQLVTKLGAESTNERATAFGGITALSQIAQGKDVTSAVGAGLEEAYTRGARLEDLAELPQIANLDLDFDFGVNDVVSNLGLEFPDLNMQGYSLPSLADLGVNLNNLNIQAPDILSGDFNLPEVADLGLDLGKVDFSGYKTSDIGDYNLKELGDLGIDVNKLNLQPEFQMIGLAQLLEGEQPQLPTQEDEEFASLDSEFDKELQPEEIPFSRQVLERAV